MAIRSQRAALTDAPATPAPAKIVPTRKGSYVPPSRQNRVAVAFYVDPTTKRQLETICFNERKKLAHLMLEACDMVFQSRQMTRTAVEGRAAQEAAE